MVLAVTDRLVISLTGTDGMGHGTHGSKAHQSLSSGPVLRTTTEKRLHGRCRPCEQALELSAHNPGDPFDSSSCLRRNSGTSRCTDFFSTAPTSKRPPNHRSIIVNGLLVSCSSGLIKPRRSCHSRHLSSRRGGVVELLVFLTHHCVTTASAHQSPVYCGTEFRLAP